MSEFLQQYESICGIYFYMIVIFDNRLQFVHFQCLFTLLSVIAFITIDKSAAFSSHLTGQFLVIPS